MNRSDSRDRITPVLPVSDVDAASCYFRDKLGFTIERRAQGDWDSAVVARSKSTIMLVPKDWPPGCSIEVDDVDAVFEELRSRQAEFESGPMNQEYDQRDFLVRGSDGYEIRFWGPEKTYENESSPPDETGDPNVPF